MNGRNRCNHFLQRAGFEQRIDFVTGHTEDAGADLARVLAEQWRWAQLRLGDSERQRRTVLGLHRSIDPGLIEGPYESPGDQVRVLGKVRYAAHEARGHAGCLQEFGYLSWSPLAGPLRQRGLDRTAGVTSAFGRREFRFLRPLRIAEPMHQALPIGIV